MVTIEEHTWECDDKFSSLGADMSLDQSFYVLIDNHYCWKSVKTTKSFMKSINKTTTKQTKEKIWKGQQYIFMTCTYCEVQIWFYLSKYTKTSLNNLKIYKDIVKML